MEQDRPEEGQEGLTTLPFGLLAWLYLIVLWLTWAPTGGSPSRILILPPTPGWNVVAGNLALFAPLGVVLAASLRRLSGSSRMGALVRRVGVVTAVAGVAVLLSLVVELGQLRVQGRTTSSYDVAMNGAGAAGAAWLTLLLLRRGVPGTWLTRGTAGVVFAAVLLFLTSTAFATSRLLTLHQWSPDYGIAVGEEVGGARGFVGTIRAPRICAGSKEDTVCAEPILGDVQGEEISPGVREHLQVAAMSSQVVSLSATIHPEGVQEGPARIVTFSRNTSYRNATLGQEGSDLVLRLRMPLSGPNATEAEFLFPGVVEGGVEARVTASYRPGVARAEVESGGNLRAAESRWGLLSSWTLMVGPRENKIRPRTLLLAAMVGAAGFSLPLGIAASGFGIFSWARSGWGLSLPLPLRLLLAAGAPPALLFQLSSPLGIPIHGREILLVAFFGILGAVAHHAGTWIGGGTATTASRDAGNGSSYPSARSRKTTRP